MADDVHLLIISQSLTLTDMTIVLPYLDVSWRGYKLGDKSFQMEICHTLAQSRVIWQQNDARFDVTPSSVFQNHEQNNVKAVHAAWGKNSFYFNFWIKNILNVNSCSPPSALNV
jgi:hypothetical protein